MDESATQTAEPVDTSTMCLNCDSPMRPEGAHYRCDECGWRDACCEGIY